MAAAGGERESGFSVVELLIALTLMAFLATSLLSIISMGGSAFERILDKKSAQNEVRIALSYVTVKLRQNSSKAKVSVIPSDSATNAGNVLKIDADPDKISAESYFIYFEKGDEGGSGRLVEKYSSAPYVDDPAGAQKIATVTEFDISYANDDQSIIKITVGYEGAGGRIVRDVSVALRAS